MLFRSMYALATKKCDAQLRARLQDVAACRLGRILSSSRAITCSFSVSGRGLVAVPDSPNLMHELLVLSPERLEGQTSFGLPFGFAGLAARRVVLIFSGLVDLVLAWDRAHLFVLGQADGVVGASPSAAVAVSPRRRQSPL
jgi:hypothetical protein